MDSGRTHLVNTLNNEREKCVLYAIAPVVVVYRRFINSRVQGLLKTYYFEILNGHFLLLYPSHILVIF